MSPLNRAGEGGGAGGGNPRFGSRGVSSPCIPCATMRNKGIVQNGGRVRELLYHRYGISRTTDTLYHVPREHYIAYLSYTILCGTITLVRPRQNGQWSLLLGSRALCRLGRLQVNTRVACGCLPTMHVVCCLGRRYSATWRDGTLPLGVPVVCRLGRGQIASQCACTLLLGVPALCRLSRWLAAA